MKKPKVVTEKRWGVWDSLYSAFWWDTFETRKDARVEAKKYGTGFRLVRVEIRYTIPGKEKA